MYMRTSQGFPAQFPPRSATEFTIFRVALVSCGIRPCCSSVLRNSLLSHYCVAVVCCGICHSIFLNVKRFRNVKRPAHECVWKHHVAHTNEFTCTAFPRVSSQKSSLSHGTTNPQCLREPKARRTSYNFPPIFDMGWLRLGGSLKL